MITRRSILQGAAVGGVAALIGGETIAFARASQPSTPVNFQVPAGACDCHTHIFGDPARFPFAAVRAYTPESASIEEQRALHRALHIERTVIVTPSVYGTDNSCTLDAMKHLGPISRGVAVIGEKTPDSDLDSMARAGIRGIRINMETAGQTDPALGRRRFQQAVARIHGRNWHIQIYTRLSVIEAIKDQVAAAPMPVVFDHFGGAQAALGTGQPGFATLVDLVRTGKAYVKISAPYRASTMPPDYPDVAPLAKELIAANPQRILWGSDWPHPAKPVPGRKFTEITPLWKIDDGRILNLLPEWAPDAALRKTILVENPARLYGF
ncbi:MAG TPA: amidohydrolase family protein [Candidatus Dormibacteraeota bacterium]|nr:amidohydrolase family protein [Candidatus Dormibacteraeota bacterium]